MNENGKRNRTAWKPWMVNHITPIGNIEKLTGINFLPTLNASERAEMEDFKAPALWSKN